MSELTAEQMDAIRARHEAATPGEWHYTTTDVGDEEYCIVPDEIHCTCADGTEVVIVGSVGGLAHDSFEGPYRVLYQNAESLTHGRKDALALLSHADALAAKVARLERELQGLPATIMPALINIALSTGYLVRREDGSICMTDQYNKEACEVSTDFAKAVTSICQAAKQEDSAHVAHD